MKFNELFIENMESNVREYFKGRPRAYSSCLHFELCVFHGALLFFLLFLLFYCQLFIIGKPNRKLLILFFNLMRSFTGSSLYCWLYEQNRDTFAYKVIIL